MAEKEMPTTELIHFCMPVCETAARVPSMSVFGCRRLIRMGMPEYVCRLSLRANEPAPGEFTIG